VFTSPLTFVASANCARYVGARPGLVDIAEDTYNIDVSRVNSTMAGVVPVHYAGLPVLMDRFAGRPAVVIEDASHALGALTPDGPVGNCAHSDMSVFSFHPVKPITTAEGGMVTTNDAGLAADLRRFRSHGIDRTPTDEPWYYNVVELGYNYRLTDLQAALGLSQVARIDEFIDRRNEIALRYRELLAAFPLVLPPAAPVGYRHGYHLFAIRVADRLEVFRSLRDAGIGVQVHYVPVHHHTLRDDLVLPSGGLPVADRVYSGLISLPIHVGLTEAEQDRVVESLERALS
jgi:dTDP-4-amino-4,6-dideoxygalactose transaminase